jgi:eukaryotic-like serine/threonine-protein kinase
LTVQTPSSGKRNAASSPWSSEESRDFLQERISRFSRLVFLISAGYFIAFWIVGLTWDPASLDRGLPIKAWALFHLGGMAVLLAMWMATRVRPLPAEVLRLIDGGGILLMSAATTGRCFALPLELRPDLLTVIPLFALLMYRAAVIPSEPRRTAWIGAVAIAPLPFATYVIYSRVPHPELPSPWAFAASALLFGVLAVILSTKISEVIYGLRQTIREARKLGPYTLVEKIGEGGMGAVYRASHALLRRPTAIKILPPERAGQMDLARFEREVQMTSLLTSPHTVSIYDYGRTPDGLFYYAMEYLDGIDLNELVRHDGPMHPGRVIRVLRQVCEALAEAHRGGLIHRDVKPANILVSERGGRPDFVKVVDFGLVKSVTIAGGSVTATDIVLGTPYYMAPETLQSPDRIDARSDIYALGATAYFLLTGKPVFDGATAEVFAQLLRDKPVAPSERLGRAVPASLEKLILAALAKSPGERPESMEAFDAALEACRDAPAWNDAEASAWWRSRRPLIRASRAGSTSHGGETDQPTLAIAHDARRSSG